MTEDNKKVALTVRVEKELYTQFRIATIKNGLSIQKCLEAYVKDYVEKNK